MIAASSPPNPLAQPFWLQKLQWVSDPIRYMETAVQQYPDIFAAGVVGKGNHLVFVSQPQAIQEILTRDRKTFSAPGHLNTILAPLLGDNSMIMLDGEPHRRQRQLLMPPFHGDRMRAYGQLIQDLTTQTFSQLSPHQPFTARTITQEISLQVIMQAVFGLANGDRFEHLKQRLTAMTEVFRSPLSSSFLFFPFLQKDWGAWSPWGRFVRDRQHIDNLVYTEIAERRERSMDDRIDILSLLMMARDEAGQPMTDQELRDELMTMLFAGHETTATAMSWALYWIHRQPAILAKLRQELATVNAATDPADVVRLPYLTAVCNETLRIHPVAMITFPRVVEESITLLGHHLQPGTVVAGCMYLLHHRPDLYPDSKQFRPERFLERTFSPYEFMPFGGGVRRCLGEALALFEMKLVLATILANYELALADTKPDYPRRRGVTLAPANGVRMILTGTRSQPAPSLAEAT